MDKMISHGAVLTGMQRRGHARSLPLGQFRAEGQRAGSTSTTGKYIALN